MIEVYDLAEVNIKADNSPAYYALAQRLADDFPTTPCLVLAAADRRNRVTACVGSNAMLNPTTAHVTGGEGREKIMWGMKGALIPLAKVTLKAYCEACSGCKTRMTKTEKGITILRMPLPPQPA